MRGEKRGQSFAQVGVDETLGAAFADVAEVDEGDGGAVELKSERRAVEIAAGKNIAVVDKN